MVFGNYRSQRYVYYLIPVINDDRKYLRFEFVGQMFEFTCLPMGLCTALYVYTKLMKPVIYHLSEAGFVSVSYLDDFLLMGESKVHCQENVDRTLSCIAFLGFVINFRKSSLRPQKTQKYLSMLYDTERMIVAIPGDKTRTIKLLVSQFSNKQVCTIGDFSKLINTLVLICPAVKYGWI